MVLSYISYQELLVPSKVFVQTTHSEARPGLYSGAIRHGHPFEYGAAVPRNSGERPIRQ